MTRADYTVVFFIINLADDRLIVTYRPNLSSRYEKVPLLTNLVFNVTLHVWRSSLRHAFIQALRIQAPSSPRLHHWPRYARCINNQCNVM